MATIVQQKAELERKMAEAEKNKQWWILIGRVYEGERLDPDWFVAAAFYRAAMIELVGQKYPNDPDVQAAVNANRRVRELADKFGL